MREVFSVAAPHGHRSGFASLAKIEHATALEVVARAPRTIGLLGGKPERCVDDFV